MIENLSGQHETVNYRKNTHLRLYNNDEAENYPPHWHTPFELIMPTKSWYKVRCGNREYFLREGDILIICPGVLHELFAPEQGVRIIFQPLLSSFSLSDLDLLISMIDPAVLITPETHPQIYEQVQKRLLEIRDEYLLAPSFAESSIYSKVLEILVLVGRHHAEMVRQGFDAKDSKQQEYMKKFDFICGYISEHFSEQLTLDDMASMAGFSKYHFTRLFKQYTDCSFYQYLNQKRINYAKLLLTDKQIPILEVSLRSGYSNLSAFLRMFKKIAGCTPSELRKMYVEDIDRPQGEKIEEAQRENRTETRDLIV